MAKITVKQQQITTIELPDIFKVKDKYCGHKSYYKIMGDMYEHIYTTPSGMTHLIRNNIKYLNESDTSNIVEVTLEEFESVKREVIELLTK